MLVNYSMANENERSKVLVRIKRSTKKEEADGYQRKVQVSFLGVNHILEEVLLVLV